MNRRGLLIVLTIGAVGGGVFAAFPQLDLMLASVFYRGGWGSWLTAHAVWSLTLRDWATWLIALIVAPAILAPVAKLLLPRHPMLMSGRAIILMISTLILAPGVLANLILKDHWGRPRPFYVQQFGGPDQFVPWWDPRGTCRGNCSFVSGEASGAFWTMAPAALTPPPVRVIAYGAAIVFGTAVGVLRMSAGGHFASDVVFAGVFTFLVIWLVHGLLYRWRPTRLTDAGIERVLAGVTTPLYDAVMRIAARVRGIAPRN